MSDILYGVLNNIQKRLKDMGDGTHAEVVQSYSGTKTSDGSIVNVESLPQTLAYNADGTLNYIQITDGVSIWRQTLTYASGKVVAISKWVKQ
jgi:hypothetical protein